MIKKTPGREPKTKNTKQDIMQNAFNLFSQKGLKDISMREIAQACGVSKPVIYYYFKDKDDLCFEMVNNMARFQAQKLLALAEHGPFETFLENIIASHTNGKKNKAIVSFMLHLHSYAPAHPRLTKRLRSLKDEQGGVLIRCIKKEVASGRLSAKEQATLLHLIIAAVTHSVINRGEERVKFNKSYPKDMARAILKAVGYK
ncbi:MAG: TetR/AcrR family transcriptional regulator [Elusimicrobiota bacterium]|jgi:AcrR family transcriptional regulator|nr:TetR/AcrR family transcriptional regulator [Elusimicrobiota bacterium]